MTKAHFVLLVELAAIVRRNLSLAKNKDTHTIDVLKSVDEEIAFAIVGD